MGLRFGSFELRPRERRLLAHGETVALGARAFDVLLALAERTNRVVSKNELLDLAWPGLVVEENNITVQISALRKVLGAAAIATVTGRGYRLALAGENEASGGPTQPSSTTVSPAPSLGKPRSIQNLVRLQRRLAVIVHADVVGWSRLVERDAPNAIQAWKSTRTELIEDSLSAYGGHPLELTPERALLEFGSVVEAVSWSLDLLAALGKRRGASASQTLHMRIGICVDDAIVDDGKLVGDGTIMAADIHQIAGHDEVLVTESVRDFAAHKLPVRFEAIGERILRRSARTVALYRVSAQVEPALERRAVARAMPGRLASLAVLPLASDGPVANAYFGDGLSEELIASLSLNRALLVIAHSSTWRFRGQQFDLRDVAAELGVRYLVTGTVRRAGNALRIGVALIEAERTNRVIWQEHYDGSDDDVFGFQARISASIAAAIDPQVQQAEIERVRRSPTDSFGAYDCMLRALAGIYQFGTAEFSSAGAMLQRAVQTDPDYAQAHAWLAWWYSLVAGEGSAPPQVEQRRLALDHAQRAVQLDPRDAWSLSVAGHLLTLFKKQHEQAIDLFDQALSINPNSAAAWARSATTLAYLGRSQESLERASRAIRLSPFDRHMFSFFTTCGNACLVAGRADEAVGWLGKALRLNPAFNGARRLQIAALVESGELLEAQDLARELMTADPDFSVQAFGSWYPLCPPYLDRLLHALRRAGLPD